MLACARSSSTVDAGGGHGAGDRRGRGVGSVAIAVLATLGYTVAASTGRGSLHDYLKGLAPRRSSSAPRWPSRRSARSTASAGPARSTRSAATTLATVLTSSPMAARSQRAAWPAAMRCHHRDPFLLRALICWASTRSCARSIGAGRVARLVRDLPMDKLDALTEIVPLAKLPALAGEILNGAVRGRIVVDVNA